MEGRRVGCVAGQDVEGDAVMNIVQNVGADSGVIELEMGRARDLRLIEDDRAARIRAGIVAAADW